MSTEQSITRSDVVSTWAWPSETTIDQKPRIGTSLVHSVMRRIATTRQRDGPFGRGDEYGIAANDTRHPDVSSGIPWPQEVEHWFDDPPTRRASTPPAPDVSEILPEDIAEFAKMKEVKVASTDEWMSVMAKLPEEKVKEAFAKLLSEPPKKDWGGESNDHYSSNVTVGKRRTTAAFLFKGPTMFREMTLEMCGKRADQIYRLAKSGAEISVVQHSHLIGEAVRETLRHMIVYPGQVRKYCVIDGQATYRILRAYELL